MKRIFLAPRGFIRPWLAFCLVPLLVLQALQAPQVFGADIKIEFLPPPMDGTISLGIYNADGKLVRILHREADTDEFRVALNGLVTRWDGKDDAGAPCPPGKYHARGYSVGDLKLDGVDFHGNDWVTDDDSPRISRISRISAQPDGTLLVEATVPGESELKTFIVAPVTPETPESPETPEVEAQEWKLKLAPEGVALPAATPEATAPGGEAETWTLKEGRVQKEGAGEPLLVIEPSPDGPPATQLSSAPGANRLFILHENPELQILMAVNPEQLPESLFQRTVRSSDRLEQVASLLKFSDGTPFVPEPSLKVPLIANPLLRKGSGLAQVKVEADASGTVLTTIDGLPLTRVSETPHLKWAVIGRSANAKKRVATIFESDGAVIAEFKAERLDNMMAFDAGLFELKAEAAEVHPAPEATPEPTIVPATPEETPGIPERPAAAPAPEVPPTPETSESTPASIETP